MRGVYSPRARPNLGQEPKTYKKVNLDMDPTRFFEAHGTGTPVGDPMEAKAIGSSFRQARSVKDPLWVGSIKSNVGHLEGASE